MVTGASGRSEAYFARVLARNGAKVVVGARRESRLVELVESMESEEGGCVAAFPMDVTEQASVRSAFDFATSEFGIVDIVSNNAGIASGKLALEEGDADWDRVSRTNLEGVRPRWCKPESNSEKPAAVAAERCRHREGRH
jgi:3-oxoacyl-[acyl-carrier protein] reductase